MTCCAEAGADAAAAKIAAAAANASLIVKVLSFG